MRILILTSLYPSPWLPHRGAFNRQQFAALAREHEVRMIAPVSWTDEWRSSAGKGCTDRFILRDGVQVEHPRFVFPPRMLRSRHGDFHANSVRAAFERAVDEFKPQVVLASWAYPDAWAAIKLSRRANLPVVAKVHGSDVLLAAERSASVGRTVEALTGADAVVAVSGQLASAVQKLGVPPERVHLVYNGVDQSLFHPGSTALAGSKLNLAPEPLILFVGNLVAVKNIAALVRACAHLRDAGIAFQCAIIGQGDLRSALTRQIDAAGLGQTVRLLGSKPLEELPDWYRAASVLALPSFSEGIPNVIQEALACGTPVVASDVGGIPEILPPDSLTAPNNPLMLAKALERALSGSHTATWKPKSWAASAGELATVLAGAIARRQKVAA